MACEIQIVTTSATRNS